MYGISTLQATTNEMLTKRHWQFLVRSLLLLGVFFFSFEYFESYHFSEDPPRQTRLKKTIQMLDTSYGNNAETLMAINGKTVKERVDDDVGLFLLAAISNLAVHEFTGKTIYPSQKNVWRIQTLPYFALLIVLATTVKSLTLFALGSVALTVGIQDVSIAYLMNNRLAPAVAFIFAITLALDICFSKARPMGAEIFTMLLAGVALGLFSYIRADNFYITIPIFLITAGYKIYEIKVARSLWKSLVPLISLFAGYFLLSKFLFASLVHFLEFYDGMEHFGQALRHSAWHPLFMGMGVGTAPNYENICWIDSCGYTLAGQIDPNILSFADYEPIAKILFMDILANNPWLFIEAIAFKYSYFFDAHRSGVMFYLISVGIFLSITVPFSRNPKYILVLLPFFGFILTLGPGIGGAPVAAATAPNVATTYLQMFSLLLLGPIVYYVPRHFSHINVTRVIQATTLASLCVGFYYSDWIVTRTANVLRTQQLAELKGVLTHSSTKEIENLHAANFARAFNELDIDSRKQVLDQIMTSAKPLKISVNKFTTPNFDLLHAHYIGDSLCLFIDRSEDFQDEPLSLKQPYDIMLFRPESPDYPYRGLLRYFNNVIQIDPNLNAKTTAFCHRVHSQKGQIKVSNVKRLTREHHHFYYLMRFKPEDNDYSYVIGQPT